MRLGFILTTCCRPELCKLSGQRISEVITILKSEIRGLETFVVLADDGSVGDTNGPWDLVIKHTNVHGIQRSFAAAYAAAAPWTDIIWHCEDDRPLIPERCHNLGKIFKVIEKDQRIGAFGLFAYWTPDVYIKFLESKGLSVVNQYRADNLDIYLFSYSEQHPWATFSFNGTLIRSKLVNTTTTLGMSPVSIGDVENIMAKRVMRAGLFGAYCPQFHALAEDINPPHSRGWEILSGMGMIDINPIPDITGWFNFADVYSQAIEEATGPSIFVELGALLGKSAAYMAREIKHSGKPIKFYSVDFFREDHKLLDKGKLVATTLENFVENMRKYDAVDYVTPIKSDSSEAAKLFKDQSVDFLFIDANHSYEGVMADLLSWLPKMKRGSKIAGHDTQEPGVVMATYQVFGLQVQDISNNSWIVRLP